MLLTSLRTPLLVLTSLLLVGAGCSRATPSTPATSTGSGSSGSAPLADGARSSCEHPYYPLRPGYEIVFRNTSHSPIDGTPQTSNYSWKVTGATADTVELAVHFDAEDITSTQTLKCRDGALEASAYVDLNGGAGRQSYHLETRNASGTYLPSDLRVGSEWTQSFDIIMRPSAGTDPVLGTIEGTVTIHRQALAEESVTVPAGTYTALKVESRTSLNFGSIAGVLDASAGAVDVVSHEWWVKNVGLVKTQATIGGSLTGLSEAERITLP